MTDTNHIRGKKAYKYGAGFEEAVKTILKSKGYILIKIPNGAKMVRAKMGGTFLVPIKSPFDFLAVREGKAICFDCKTYQKNTIAHSDLKPHQVHSLYQIYAYGKLWAGYIVYFRPSDKIVAFSSKVLWALTPNNSLNESDGILLGSLGDFSLNELHGGMGEA